MAAFFVGAKILFEGYSDAFEKVVTRTEMDRGFAKQRRTQADVLVTETVSLLFTAKQMAADFDTWFYYAVNAGADFFDWVSPRTEVTVQARIVSGDIGALTPHSGHFGASHRTFKVEWFKTL